MSKSAPKTQRISKNAGKTRTSMWLDDTLRKRIDERAAKEQRSLAFMLDALLRKALGLSPRNEPAKASKTAEAKAAKPDEKPHAPIFG